MRTISDADRALLVSALAQQTPVYAEGLWTFAHDELKLLIHNGSWYLNLGKDATSTAELEKLLQTCQPASLGVNQDVPDESSRNAGKLDEKDFSINVDVVGSGMLHAVQNALFSWEPSPRNIRAELYELNVYGSGSFSNTRRGTPCSDDAFGSLVLSFPVKHEGGALVLRHGGNEFTHDAAGVNYTSPNQVSWIAFYNDVGREVLPVTSGHSVTITYNLYFTNSPADSGLAMNAVEAALRKCVRSESFLPYGGRLGFGLQHQYRIPSDMAGAQSVRYLMDLYSALKGIDRALHDACDELDLCPSVQITYDTGREGAFLLDHIYEGKVAFESWDDAFGAAGGAEKIEPGEDDSVDSDEEQDIGEDLVWVIPRQSSKTRIKSYYVPYGDEARLNTIYGELVLLATVPPKRERSTSPSPEPE
ncbi:hypothetical protein AURDEDRAFT_164700 [Auricularia subglabra TFB-10046 SS5]|nr:hypothetical protein AURDEDRAFT_164700 [Auricularia subglabra TFB-10046 SS5]